MAGKAEYEWGCGDIRADGFACVKSFPTEEEARAHNVDCEGVLVVRQKNKDRGWDIV